MLGIGVFTVTLRACVIRLITIAVTLLGVGVVVFVVIRIAPGDPISMMLPPGASDSDIAHLRALYGLDKSLFEQFLVWLGGLIRGDFGVSISLRQSVLTIVLGRLPATLELSLLALLIALILGTALAIIATHRRGRSGETIIDFFTGIGLSTPDFLWGLGLILLFAVAWPLFPVSGRISPHLDPDFITNFYLIEAMLRLRFDILANLLHHMLMPALALALPFAAIITHLLKQALKDEMRLDYIILARAKGFSEFRVIITEALRNAVLPTLALTGVQFTFVIGGTVIVERLFSYEGLGNLAIDAVINRDLPLIQGIIILFSILFIAVNLIVDIAAVLLNPRLRDG